jgi:hypothetical protein
MPDSTNRTADAAVREHLKRVLDWEDAHAGFEATVKDFPAELRGRVPEGLPYSAWQIVEHLRLAQHDILDFCVNPHYEEMKWPDDYWPAAAAPPSGLAWDESIQKFIDDRSRVQQLVSDPAVDLLAKIPHGSGQTYLREVLLIADHSAYHVGQLLIVRRLLGAWPK